MDNSNGIGTRIKELREAIHETQLDLANALQARRETVNQWEHGTRDLKTQYTVSLAEHFGTTCDYILRGVQAENISIYEKTGLSEEAINKLYLKKHNKVILYSIGGKEYVQQTTEEEGLKDIKKRGGQNIKIVTSDDFTKTVDVLIKSEFNIIDDISKFLFADFVNYDRETENDTGDCFRIQKKGQKAISFIETSEINSVYLLKAQAKLLFLKKKFFPII